MAELFSRRNVTWLVRVGIVAAVVVVALLVRGAGGDDTDDGSASPGDASSTATPSAPPTKVDPDTFCQAFVLFADAQAQYVADPDNPTTEQGLVDAGDALLGLGQPIGLSDGGLVSLRELIDSALAQEGDPTDVPTTDVPGDDAALADFLGASCPA